MLRKLGAGILVLAAAVACGDSTGPEDFDPVTTQQKTDVILAAFDDNPALASLAAVEGLPLGGPLLAATVPTSPSAFATGASLRRLVEAARPSFGSTAVFAIFPADLLGATFVWSPGQGYVEDANAVGAPADGIRVILYTVNPLTQVPTQPLEPRGYLDIIDESTVSSDALHLVAVWEDVTHLDYVASAVQTTTSITLSADGYLSNGTDQVDFDLSVTGSEGEVAFTLDYLLEHEEGSIRLAGESIDEENANLTLTLDDGDNRVDLEIHFTPSTISGTLEYNGDVAIEISGTREEPVFTRPDGTPLTDQEVAALQALGLAIGVVFDAFDNLLGPALVAFLLG
jgi:hypothetical protein